MNDIAIVIPVRLNSTRLPEKVLLDLAGKPIIQHVYERCISVPCIDHVIIAVDSLRLYERCSEFCKNVVITSPDHMSGTDRVAEAIDQFPNVKYIINVQGDEPFIKSSTIESVAKELKSNNSSMVTSACLIEDTIDLHNKSVVKVVFDKADYALYFSRSVIPCTSHSDNAFLYYKHVGIYGYSRKLLYQFVNWDQSNLEKIENLEQLRALSNSVRIKIVKSEESLGIDTSEDYEKARRLIGEGRIN
jgi:3-deoxy-manno-octulosonate cytidylyltransferase (CMP-KDO synthetase)